MKATLPPRHPYHIAARLLALSCLFLVGGCGTSASHPPTARISVSPAYVPRGDEFQTAVTLDGTASSASLDDPDAGQPLRFQWEVDASEVRVASGGFDQPLVVIRLPGDRTVPVKLTVTDPNGQTDTRSAVVGVSVPP